MVAFRIFLAVLLLAFGISPAAAQLQFAIGEPAEGSVKSGIGQVSGWAVSDRKIVSIEAFIDGASLGLVPYGGSRLDVAMAFPGYPEAEFSGWSMKWNYALHEPGQHLLTLVVTEDDGTVTTRDVAFSTTRFHDEFISEPDDVRIMGATIDTPSDTSLRLEGAEIQGETVDIELVWDGPSQQFLIHKITYPDEPQPNQAPTANAGPDLEAATGVMVEVTGSGTDPDGTIASRVWTLVAGPPVTLVNSSQWSTRFLAPDEPGLVRLRLTVTDNEGMSASDDVLVSIVEAPPPPPPPTNQPPTANAGSDRSVTQGATVSITGGGSDPDGNIVAWAWTRVSGLSVTLTGANTPTVQFTAPGSAGTIDLRLTVTDDDGATGYDDVTVTVEAAPPPDPTTGGPVQSMLAVINVARGQARSCGTQSFPAQPPLAWSGALAGPAVAHSMDMARNGYFSHTSLNGDTIGDRLWPVWSGTRIGENIAASSVVRSDEYVVDLWLNSPGHCELIMDPNFTHAAIGYGRNDDNGYTYHHFWTLDFGG